MKNNGCKENSKEAKGRGKHPRYKVAPIESVNSTGSPVHAADPPMVEILPEAIRPSQLGSRPALKAKYKDVEVRLEQMEENNWLKLECLRQSSEYTLRKYQEDTKKNLTEALPILKSNLVLHAQVAAGPLNLSKVNFNCLQKPRIKEEEDLDDLIDLEEISRKHLQLEKAPIEPTDQPIEAEN
ncbi:hypothetical protein J1N35_021585 [Gossypium stocksii]|uniref:Uncharacterized protein n=1 Tax=Gossypium stocksii TaxID=47602 RepID=A0A9D3VG63_9ROSI|nr:hypothetical protein J1N35_021585 [Gossypium stocksii]